VKAVSSRDDSVGKELGSGRGAALTQAGRRRRRELGGYKRDRELLRHGDEQRPGVEGDCELALGETGRRRRAGHALRTRRDGTLRTEERGFRQHPLFCTHGNRREPPTTAIQVAARGDRANDRRAPHVSENSVLIKPRYPFSVREK
jgi:hypothetical protein